MISLFFSFHFLEAPPLIISGFFADPRSRVILEKLIQLTILCHPCHLLSHFLTRTATNSKKNMIDRVQRGTFKIILSEL